MTERAFVSDFPDSISFVTKEGTRFSFSNNYIKTDDPELLAELDKMLKNKFYSIREVDPSEAPPQKVLTAASRIPKDMGTGGTISPNDLRMRMEALKGKEESKQLEAAAPIPVNPVSQGITSTASIAKNMAASDSKAAK